MNWTGGALSRSRNAKSKVSLSVKQRNHFAKARIKLQSKQRPSPPAIQYFDFGEWKPETRVHDDQRSDPVRQPAPSQRTLEQFENVQGVVRKLKSLRPRDQGQKRKRSVINDNEGDTLPSGIPLPPLSPSINDSRPPSSFPSVQIEPTPKRSAKRLEHATPSTNNDPSPLAALDSVEAKRRKLLQESDWTGVDRQRRMSKPVKMSFISAKDRDLIGRRRSLNDSAIRSRRVVQGPRSTKIPLMTSDYEKARGLHVGLADEYWSSDNINIGIGSTGTTKGPISDEILDIYQSPRLVQRLPHLENAIHYDNAGVTVQSQQQKRGDAYHPAFNNDSSSPFQSLFSSAEVEQSGMAQLVEAATVTDDNNLPVAEDGLHLPEDYHFPEPEPGFRLVFDKTPHPHGQTSELDIGSSPIIRDFAFTERQRSGAVIEHQAPTVTLYDDQISSQASPQPIVEKVPPSWPDEDELLWRKFIFSDSDPIDQEWTIEGEKARPKPPLDTHISKYNAIRTPPSMVAEVATSPLKQNPHLLDEIMLDSSTPAFNDDASRHANISTSSTESPAVTTGTATRTPQQDLPHPSHTPNRSYSTASPALHDTQTDNTTTTKPSLPTKTRKAQLSNASSLVIEAPSSNPFQYLSATNDPSSDELAWTPSRISSGPSISTEKVIFRKPSRYVGERANAAPEPVHLGRKVSSRKNRNEKTSLAEAVKRARGKMSGKRRERGRDDGRYGGREMEAEAELETDEDEDDIVDD